MKNKSVRLLFCALFVAFSLVLALSREEPKNGLYMDAQRTERPFDMIAGGWLSD